MTTETKNITVRDFIKQLLELNQDAEISFQISEGCCGDYDFLGQPDLDQVDYKEKGVDKSFINFRFPALAIMSSCITYGIARRAVERHRSPKTSVEDRNAAYAHSEYIASLKKDPKNE